VGHLLTDGPPFLLRTHVVVEPPRLFSKPLARFNGGYVHYDFSYRSNIDTPFAEWNITQHTINGRFDFVAGNILPLTLNYFIRQSNSGLFRDLAEAQVQFDAEAVLQYLVSKGISISRLNAQGFGQERPIAPNTSAQGQSKNRRVEMKLSY